MGKHLVQFCPIIKIVNHKQKKSPHEKARKKMSQSLSVAQEASAYQPQPVDKGSIKI